MARTFEQFIQEVRDSIENHAKRKGYTKGDANDNNQLGNLFNELGIHNGHAVGEIICKLTEFLKDPKPLLMIKVAGWAWLIWRYLPEPGPVPYADH